MSSTTHKFFEAFSSDKNRDLRENGKSRPYSNKAADFDDYESTYGNGVASHTKHPGRIFDDVESDLSRDWNASRGKSPRNLDRARLASRDAWDLLNTRK